MADLAALIARRLSAALEPSREAFERSGAIRHTIVDDLLPGDIAMQIGARFPPPEAMVHKRSLREDKFISVQMDELGSLLRQAVFAFHHPSVIDLVSDITGMEGLEADPLLYAGGISLMTRGQFLQPHIDNSHDRDRHRWRVLNLLYYVSPSWDPADGGHLELWKDGVRREPVTVDYRCNRLVIMETHGSSFHSVSPVTAERQRTCVSNYYFAASPSRPTDRYHVTSFRSRPGQPIRDVLLRADSAGKMLARRVLGSRWPTNPHAYKL